MALTYTGELIVTHDGRIQIDDLPVRIGEHVRVVVIRDHHTDAADDKHPLRATVIRYDNLFGPACDPDDWEANR